ncbi:MAG: 6-phosphogluconolactonase [Sediminicola sp.]
MELRIADTKGQVAKDFCEYLYKITHSEKPVHIALSGGSTPKIVFDYLAMGYADGIDWEKVHFYWGDERCVPPDDEQSNYRMTEEHLLRLIPIPDENVHRIKGEDIPEQEAIRYAGILKSKLPVVAGVPQFDLVILGMGDDGHTASIFPYNIYLWDSISVCEVAVHSDSGQKRITITGKVINTAKEVAFLVTGPDKAEKVREIVKGEGRFADYPASLVAPKSGKLIWFLDKAAAGGISPVQA